jgi:lipopolysaccharide transport system ATP-binding protein
MSDAIIKVSNLGKCYRLRHNAERQRYVALRDVIAEKAKGFFKKQKLRNQKSEINNAGGQDKFPISKFPISALPTSEDFWALRDVSFEVKRGEVVGIIGRNGAGKSTLLKILSRITEPTTGRVELDGRVASLLEVGTGFHPELTGRENIFLNGAILGMSRAEIRRKFDEIVAFAEVEKFLDTPVKRYSSGMYVRLAFAVAAHLEPEILIVDEVLAVGDAEFQKKCLGKMQDVAKGGRTVLFVSHNLAAVQSLTSRAIFLRQGEVIFNSDTGSAIEFYRAQMNNGLSESQAIFGRGSHTRIISVELKTENGEATDSVVGGHPFIIEVVMETDGTSGMSLDFILNDALGQPIGFASTIFFANVMLPSKRGTFTTKCIIEPLWLASGCYSFNVSTAVANIAWDHNVISAIEFSVEYCNPNMMSFDFKQSYGYGSRAIRFMEVPRFESLSSERD